MLILLGSLAPLGTAQGRGRAQHQQQQDQQDTATQSAAKQKKRGPRAIAVLEFLPGGGTRLVPVALWINDRFYDASLYGADPEPMALQPETVYETTNYGEPTGLFTVTQPEQVKGSWVGTGQWKAEKPLEKRIAQQAAKQPKPVEVSNPADDRPTLHRAAGSSDSDSSKAAGSGVGDTGSASKPSSPEPPDRPTLKKPVSEASSQPTATTQAPSLGASASPGAPSSSSASAASPDESDPNRPILRRGKPAGSAASETRTATLQPAATEPSSQLAPAGVTVLSRRSYPAVSDATPHEARSLLYVMNASEHTNKSEQLGKLAMDEIRSFATQRKAALPKGATITDYDLRAFDLDYSNSPTLVFTGKLPVPTAKAFGGGEFDYFVTLVTREDINGGPIKIFSSVTDSNHLDAYPRLEIIDAVDADANGRGDLLFRQYSDTGVNYSLYRVHPYDMQKIFEGGSGV